MLAPIGSLQVFDATGGTGAADAARLEELGPRLLERSIPMAPAGVLSAFPLLAEDY